MYRWKATRTVVVANQEGLHARAATLIADLVRQFQAKVEVIKCGERVEAVDVLQVLSLGAEAGDQLLLEASGQDADAVLEALVELFGTGLADDEPAGNTES